MGENKTDNSSTDESHTDNKDKLVELNTEETEQVVGGKLVRRIDLLPQKM